LLVIQNKINQRQKTAASI